MPTPNGPPTIRARKNSPHGKASVEAAEAALVAAKKDYADSKESLDQIQWEFTNAQGELAQLESEEKKLLEKLRKGDQ